MPHFRLPAPASGFLVDCRICIIGMHLDGELVVRKNEFHKDGEIIRIAATCSAPFRRHLPPCFSQGFSSIRSSNNLAIDTRKPGFADRFRRSEEHTSELQSPMY